MVDFSSFIFAKRSLMLSFIGPCEMAVLLIEDCSLWLELIEPVEDSLKSFGEESALNFSVVSNSFLLPSKNL